MPEKARYVDRSERRLAKKELGEISRWGPDALIEAFEDQGAPGTVPMRGRATARQCFVNQQQAAKMNTDHLQLEG